MKGSPLSSPNSNTRTLIRVGQKILDGPEVIYARDDVVSSYLECTFTIVWHSASRDVFRSCRIYCDACGDGQRGFLSPLARIAEWQKHLDVFSLKPPWPNVRVTLLELPLDCERLHAEVSRVQSLVDGRRLTKSGLATRRDGWEATFEGLGHLRVETQAGSQWLSRAFWISEADECRDVFDSVTAIVLESGVAAGSERWLEYYDGSFEELCRGESWMWGYEPNPWRNKDG